MNMSKHDPIYKFDTKGKARIWYMEQDGSRHRTIAGIKDGNLVTSAWTQCEATNVGRSNERDPVAQAYEKKLTREYHRDLEGAGGGAHFFKPMLAEKYVTFAPGYAQPKLDGIRCIAKANGLWSREGKAITGVPHIWEMFKPLFDETPDLIFDGELYNHDYKEDFDSISSAVRKKTPTEEEMLLARKLQYHAYDLPSFPGTFSARSAALANIVATVFNPFLQFVETRRVLTQEEADTAHGEWLEMIYEGSIWRADSEYENRRTKALQKRKEFIDEEFELIAIEAGKGNWAGAAKRVVCRLPDGRTFEGGIKGTRERGRVLLHEIHKIVTIKYFRLTPDGIPRFGVATKFHGESREL